METSPDQFAQILEQALQGLDNYWSQVLVALVGVGIVTMAILQLLKDLLPTRRWFQRWWLRHFWLYRNADENEISREHADRALEQLIVLATAGDDKALFNLPVEQLIGQLNAATQALLDRPREPQHADLMHILAPHAADDVKVLLEPRPKTKEKLTVYVDSRNRVAQQVQRSLDALQIAMGYRWSWLLQVLSVIISAIIIWASLRIYGGPEFWSRTGIAYGLIVAILGGFLAPVARDLFAAIQSLRGRAR